MNRLPVRSPTAAGRIGGRVVLCLLALLAVTSPALATPPQSQLAPERLLIVAIAERPDPPPSVGSTPRGYAGLPNYSGSLRSVASAARLAKDYGLREVSAWTITSLRLRCMLYELPPTADHDEMLTRLRRDDRVRLVQPLQSFDTLTAPRAAAVPDTAAAAPYNDPYIGLQRGFAAIGADQAQRWSSGTGVRIALIDSGVDVGHPDLRGRIALERDFVGDPDAPAAEDRHGTQVAGVIAAVANNRIGIAGVAPDAHLYAYRACWSTPDGAAARCNSFTLALALDAAIGASARIINLSLGGPADPLLEQLARHAIEHGAIVVGALPASGRLDGFPLNVPGVIAVADTDDPPSAERMLRAPGREILTLEPGGHYDYASGSSLAAAHVSGSIALLLQLDPRLRASDAVRLLDDANDATASINVCAAAQALQGSGDRCRDTAPPARRHAQR
ncbi:S8 family peptidase [Dokdonella koreensis]|uniref:Serine protease n=1 Tax=Dokdonella koreensis DS-123 TaxID=1300342 RepID=A0A160DY87_9GAMM|nr:S8 family serine peptidase [Dokdonella koreensis]ANB18993.1 Serine protease [Dokdonella koreensis DS-123]